MSNACVRHELNAPGGWHVNKEECVACDTCSGIAPQIFAHDDMGVSYVANNLSHDQAMAKLFQEACDNCPSAAIHAQERM